MKWQQIFDESCEVQKSLEGLKEKPDNIVKIEDYFNDIQRVIRNDNLATEIKDQLADYIIKEANKTCTSDRQHELVKNILSDEEVMDRLKFKSIIQYLKKIEELFGEDMFNMPDDILERINKLIKFIRVYNTFDDLSVEENCNHISPIYRKWHFLKFLLLEVNETPHKDPKHIIKISFPEHIKEVCNSSKLQRVLEAIYPNEWVKTIDGDLKLRVVSNESTPSEQVVLLKEHFDRILMEGGYPTNGICEERTDVYMDLFDELIREVAVDHSPSVAQILVDVRDHFREALLLHRTTYENSQGYVYRKQHNVKDNHVARLEEEIENIMKREKAIVEEMRCLERGLVLKQEAMFYKMNWNTRTYRKKLRSLKNSIINQLDLFENIILNEFMDTINEMKDREKEVEIRLKKKLEEDKVKKGEEDEAEDDKELALEEGEKEEEEEGDEDDALKMSSRKAMLMQLNIVYRSSEDEVFEEESESAQDEESEVLSTFSFAQPQEVDKEEATFLILSARDGLVDVTASDAEKGEVKPLKPVEEVVAESIPEKVFQEEEEVKPVEEQVAEEAEEDLEDDEGVEKHVTRRRRKSDEVDFDELQKMEEERDRLKSTAVAEEKPAKESDAKKDKEKIQTSVEEKKDKKNIEPEERFGKSEWDEELLAEGVEEGEIELEGEEEFEEDELASEGEEEEEIVSSSTPSEEEDEGEAFGDARKGEGKRKTKTSIMISHDLVDVELGDTDTSDFEDEAADASDKS